MICWFVELLDGGSFDVVGGVTDGLDGEDAFDVRSWDEGV